MIEAISYSTNGYASLVTSLFSRITKTHIEIEVFKNYTETCGIH